ncbi:MAG: methyltransferase domain-containing protein [Bacteroidia bacterium]|nr:methyltransferase domain-containing protein [Bacteroidia bacterium]
MLHYEGLIADWYDDFLLDEHADLDLYTELAAAQGGPALELACGTGRMLLALHGAGIEADGVDISPDMLERCRAKAEAAGCSPELRLAPMQKFTMDRRYRSVLVSGGSFQLLANAEDVASCLHCIREHLLPDGRLFLDVDVAEPACHAEWGIRRVAARGEETFVYMSTNTYDSVLRCNVIRTRYELIRRSRVRKVIKDTIVMRVFSSEEMSMLLQQAGFVVLEVRPVQLFDSHPGSMLFIAGCLQ